jgi:hypothetical protein
VVNQLELLLVSKYGKSRKAQSQFEVDHKTQETCQHHYASSLRILSIRFNLFTTSLLALAQLR